MTIAKGIASPIASSIAGGIVVNEAEFNPARLAGLRVWHDPSDLDTLFVDAYGQTPVTADGDLVGLMLDKSQGLALGADVTDGFPSKSVEWVVDGVSTWTCTNATTAVDLRSYSSITVGKTYQYDLTIVGDNVIWYFGLGAPVSLPAGTYRYIVKADSTNYIGRITTGNSATVTITAKELAGNHATQTNASLKPTYKTDGTYHWIYFDGTEEFYMPVGFDGAVDSDNTMCAGLRLEGFGARYLYGYIGDDGLGHLFSNYKNRPYLETTSGTIGGNGTTSINGVDKVISSEWVRLAGTYKSWQDQILEPSLSGTPANKKQGPTAYLGGFSTTSARFLGRIYNFSLYDVQLSDANRALVESYMANKSGAVLP